MIKIIKSYFLILFLVAALMAQGYNKVGTSVAQFLKIESGARATALGGAYAALANNADALYWNVAGITQLKNVEVTFSYTNWIADIKHTYAGIVVPIGEFQSLGASVIALSSDPIEQTTIDNPKGTGVMINVSDIAFGLSYARQMTDYLSVGITLKYIQQNMWDLTASSFAFDAGFLLDTGFRGLKLGMVMSNFGTDMTLSGRNLTRAYDKWPENVADPKVPASLTTKSWPIPTSYRLALAFSILDKTDALWDNVENNTLIIAVDAIHLNDNPEHYSVGIEYGFSRTFYIRTGFKGNTDENGLTAGAGLIIGVGGDINIKFDYAYADFGIFENIQQFSLGMTF